MCLCSSESKEHYVFAQYCAKVSDVGYMCIKTTQVKKRTLSKRSPVLSKYNAIAAKPRETSLCTVPS